MSVIAWITQNWDIVVGLLSALLTLASLITAITPTPKDDEVIKKIVGWLSFLLPGDQEGFVKSPFRRGPTIPVDRPLIEKRPPADRADDH